MISNSWNTLLRRVKKDQPVFRSLSFKHLRKTNAQLHHDHAQATSETIAVMQARANFSSVDDFADAYYRRSFEKVYKANDRVHEYLEPMFGAAEETSANDAAEQKDQKHASLSTRIREEYDRCGNISEVARKLGISRPTVYQHLEKGN